MSLFLSILWWECFLDAKEMIKRKERDRNGNACLVFLRLVPYPSLWLLFFVSLSLLRLSVSASCSLLCLSSFHFSVSASYFLCLSPFSFSLPLIFRICLPSFPCICLLPSSR